MTRNVARGVRIDTPENVTVIEPFTVDEAREFLRKVEDHRPYGLSVTVLMLGLRRSEALGLHWSDVDLDGKTLRIARGLQRAGGVAGTSDEEPTLPANRAYATVRGPGAPRASRSSGDRAGPGLALGGHAYVFTSSVGTPIEPRTLTRTFHALCERHGLRRVRLHDLRHSCVSLLLASG